MIFLVSKQNHWSETLYRKLSTYCECAFFNDDEYMIQAKVKKPKWIFFFHWSKIVPKEIYENEKCVVLHTGNLPRQRGGSPIQNQISEKIVETKVNALQMNENIDGGDVYCASSITLQGSLMDIWMTIVEVAYKLICKCIAGDYLLRSQVGTPQIYKRKNNNKVLFEESESLSQIYDQIRMLDAENYPLAYANLKDYKLEFSRAQLKGSEVIADVRITKR